MRLQTNHPHPESRGVSKKHPEGSLRNHIAVALERTLSGKFETRLEHQLVEPTCPQEALKQQDQVGRTLPFEKLERRTPEFGPPDQFARPI